ncbi:MAG TPA: DedA family protein [Roseiflexaceae bacterium]|nr:DedA family protein [Roseiflexaceae bacterium]
MTEIMERVRLLVEEAILALGYLGIALVMLVENLIPPIPSELVMPFAGFLVAEQKLSMVGVLLSGTLGSLLGAVILYALGRWAGDPLVRRFLRRYGHLIRVSEQDLDRALAVFDRYGEVIVLVGRLIPLVRSLISLPAGMRGMPFWRFLLFTAAGTALWNGALAGAGFLLGQNWAAVLGVIEQYQRVVLVVLAAALLWWVTRAALRWRQMRTATSR